MRTKALLLVAPTALVIGLLGAAAATADEPMPPFPTGPSRPEDVGIDPDGAQLPPGPTYSITPGPEFTGTASPGAPASPGLPQLTATVTADPNGPNPTPSPTPSPTPTPSAPAQAGGTVPAATSTATESAFDGWKAAAAGALALIAAGYVRLNLPGARRRRAQV